MRLVILTLALGALVGCVRTLSISGGSSGVDSEGIRDCIDSAFDQVSGWEVVSVGSSSLGHAAACEYELRGLTPPGEEADEMRTLDEHLRRMLDDAGASIVAASGSVQHPRFVPPAFTLHYTRGSERGLIWCRRFKERPELETVIVLWHAVH